MSVETHVDHARTRVQAEREATTAKLDALGTFRERVGDVPTDGSGSPRLTATDGGGVQSLAGGTTQDGCRAVRRAFDETVRPYSDADDEAPLLEAIRTELTDAVAAALAPNADVALTPTLERTIDLEVEARRREADLMLAVLDREAATLEDAAATIAEITDWIAAADETPLSDLGFDALRERHETLAAHRECCRDLAADRQAFLAEVTSYDGELALRHRKLLSHLYEDFPVDHPVLATAVRLEPVCEECQRAVRDHLVRRA